MKKLSYRKANIFWLISLLFALTCLGDAVGATTSVHVVASNKPLHSLVAGVMQGVGVPKLLPETASLKATSCTLSVNKEKMLQEADLVIYTSSELEPCIAKAKLSQEQRFTIKEQPGVLLLEKRQGGVWQKGALTSERYSTPRKIFAPGHHEVNEQEKEKADDFLWLSPQNVQVIIEEIAERLSRLDSKNRQRYQENAAHLIQRLEQLDHQLASQLATVQGQPFITMHDFYQYFEYHYRLNSLGAVTVKMKKVQKVGFGNISRLRKQMLDLPHVCVVTDPYTSKELVDSVAEGAKATVVEQDPFAKDLKSGADLYFNFLERLTDHLVNCLKVPKKAK